MMHVHCSYGLGNHTQRLSKNSVTCLGRENAINLETYVFSDFAHWPRNIRVHHYLTTFMLDRLARPLQRGQCQHI